MGTPRKRNSTSATTSTGAFCSRAQLLDGPSYPAAKKQQRRGGLHHRTRAVGDPRDTILNLHRCNGILTIARGLWELLTHRSTVVEKKTLTASGGSAFATWTSGWTLQPNSNEITMLVDSGVTEHFLDDELIPGLKNRTMSSTLLDVPKTIITAGNRKLLGTMTGTINGTITEETGRPHPAHFPGLIVSGLGHHILSPTTAMTRGITTTLEERNSYLRK